MKTMGTLALLGFWCAGANAQPPSDVDGDGMVSLDEFVAARTEAATRQFAMLDVDSDGFLSGDELRRGRRAGPGGPDARGRPDIDTDGDGAWSFSELQAVRPQITVEAFNGLDSNGDGLISADERPQSRFGQRARGR
jgi:Ca2+-binding EF-hand superfamily protein